MLSSYIVCKFAKNQAPSASSAVSRRLQSKIADMRYKFYQNWPVSFYGRSATNRLYMLLQRNKNNQKKQVTARDVCSYIRPFHIAAWILCQVFEARIYYSVFCDDFQKTRSNTDIYIIMVLLGLFFVARLVCLLAMLNYVSSRRRWHIPERESGL